MGSPWDDMGAVELAAAVERSPWWHPWAPGHAGGQWVERPLRLDDAHAIGCMVARLPPGWWMAQLVSGEHTVVLDTGEIARGRTLGVALARALLAHHEVSRG